MTNPLVSDPKHTIAQDHRVLKADDIISFRSLFIIYADNIFWQNSINDLPVGCSVGEILRLVHRQT
jgi:alkyl hydroperoxide reductase subunit AhpC